MSQTGERGAGQGDAGEPIWRSVRVEAGKRGWLRHSVSLDDEACQQTERLGPTRRARGHRPIRLGNPAASRPTRRILQGNRVFQQDVQFRFVFQLGDETVTQHRHEADAKQRYRTVPPLPACAGLWRLCTDRMNRREADAQTQGKDALTRREVTSQWRSCAYNFGISPVRG
jgi:hypothetical protein